MFLVRIGVSALSSSDSSRRSRIPQPPEKIESGTRDHSENAPEYPLDPVFHPVVMKITKNHFWWDFGPKKVQKMGSESGRLGSPESLKNRLGKIFSRSVIDF